VVQEQELERAGVRLRGLLALLGSTTMPSETWCCRRSAAWHLLDLDQAHAAVAVHGQVGVVAEVGDLDPDLGRGLDDGGPRRDFDFLVVDGELGHYLSSSPAMMFSPPMMATASARGDALDHLREGLVDVVAGRAHLHPPRQLGAVAHDVVPELAVGRLRVAVDLAGRGEDPSYTSLKWFIRASMLL
jgi:hypothetical protein